MELLLNLIWLGLSVAALVTWRMHRRNARGGALWREGVALTCVLVLMFFVISMSDDLQQQWILPDDTSCSRRLSVCSAESHGLPTLAHLTHQTIAADCVAGVSSPQTSCFEPIFDQHAPVPKQFVARDSAGRAPPQSFL